MAMQQKRPVKGDKKLREKHEIPVGSPEEEAWLNGIHDAVAVLDADYVRAAEKRSYGELNGNMEMMQRARHIQMFGICAGPLANGINSESIVQSLGLYIGCALFDRNFTKDVKRGVASMLLPSVDKKIDRLREKADRTGKASDLAKAQKWEKRREKCIVAANGGRMPLTPDAVALQEIAYCSKAYADMRVPGADVSEVTRQYDAAVKALHEKALKDGVDMEDVNRSMRFMCGKMAERDPATAQFFNETAYGGVKQGEYKPVYTTVIGPDGQPQTKEKFVWSGEFVAEDGTPHEGGFTPRVPLTKETYEEQLDRLWTGVHSKAMDSFDAKHIEAMTRVMCAEMRGISDEGVKRFKVSDLSPKATEGLYRAMQKCSMDYIARKGDFDVMRASEQLAMLNTCIMQDGVDADEAMKMPVDSSKRCAKNAYDKFMEVLLDNAKGHMKEYNAYGRGHEHDDMFGYGGDGRQYGDN